MNRSVKGRAGAAALALAFFLSFTLPVFAAKEAGRDPRDLRDRIIQIIKKIQNTLGVGTNDDGITPPKP